MKNLTRVLSVVLVLCMMATLVAGCGKIEVPTTPQNPTNGNVEKPTNGEQPGVTTTIDPKIGRAHV